MDLSRGLFPRRVLDRRGVAAGKPCILGRYLIDHQFFGRIDQFNSDAEPWLAAAAMKAFFAERVLIGSV